VIPLQVGDGQAGQQPVQEGEDGVPHRRLPQVQHPLMTRFHAPVPTSKPLRRGPGQRAIGTHHFRLHPKTKGHTRGFHGLGDGGKAPGQAAAILEPVPEGSSIVDPILKPTIVDHKALHPKSLGRRYELEQRLLRDIEVERFPTVEMNGARPDETALREGLAALEGVNLLTEAVGAMLGKDEPQGRGGQRLPRLQAPIPRV